MSISNNQIETEMSKEEKIELAKKRLKQSETFHITHRPRMEVKPNVQYVILLSSNWWKEPSDDPENWVMKDDSRDFDNPKTGKKDHIYDTIYRVRQIESTDQFFLQELHLGKAANAEFKKAIEKTMVLDPDRDLLIKFTKNVGATQYDVTWEVEATLA
jgi:hypothetical protein